MGQSLKFTSYNFLATTDVRLFINLQILASSELRSEQATAKEGEPRSAELEQSCTKETPARPSRKLLIQCAIRKECIHLARRKVTLGHNEAWRIAEGCLCSGQVVGCHQVHNLSTSVSSSTASSSLGWRFRELYWCCLGLLTKRERTSAVSERDVSIGG